MILYHILLLFVYQVMRVMYQYFPVWKFHIPFLHTIRLCITLPGIHAARIFCLTIQIHCPWQRENEFRSHAFGADHINILPVGLDDLFYNRQAQAGAPFVLAP